MGKSVTPYSHVVDQVEASFADFRRSLPREDQKRFDRLFNDARRHTPGGVLLGDPDPFRPVLMGMLIELLRRLDEVQDDSTCHDSTRQDSTGGHPARPDPAPGERP